MISTFPPELVHRILILSYPVFALDPDAMQRILPHSLDGPIIGSVFHRDQSSKIRQNLMGTCRFWRNIILQRGEFWTTISIRGTLLKDFQRLERRFRLAQGYPLELYMEPGTWNRTGDLPFTEETKELFGKMMSLLNSKVSQLRILAVNMGSFDSNFYIGLSSLFPAGQTWTLPCAEAIALYGGRESNAIPDCGIIEAPRLTWLALDGANQQLLTCFTKASFKSMKLFSGSLYFLRHPAELKNYKDFANIETLHLSLFLESRPPTVSDRVKLPMVRTLRLAINSPGLMQLWLRTLDVPEVRTLVIGRTATGLPHEGTLLIPDVMSKINRPSRVQHLTFSRLTLKNSNIHSIFGDFMELDVIVLDNCTVEKGFFETFFINNYLVCPSLGTLILRQSVFNPAHLEQFMMRRATFSRPSSTFPLKNVHVRIDLPKTPLEGLMKLFDLVQQYPQLMTVED
ncbi:hypothetical protein M422DRAFT_52146 [Sphaerobolus stellatus SS14]|uniref:F-box domain-containing protein n=1 Tax=Sphaerobolus stellatus (strain SS14) TaxID=990650 RepID=A0A0C9UXX5_SPHS4|nr:hypothetical protein M422DRAFT_52146 [Sphaerobolus stellatus SS14]